MARRRRSGLGVLARRALAGGAVALEDHHPAGVARASPSRGFTVHISDRVFHVGLVPGTTAADKKQVELGYSSGNEVWRW